MTPELQAQYDEAAKPFIDGAITLEATRLKPWRVFLEINSLCSLHCPTCTKGSPEGYDHKTGLMDPDLMERVLDKIQSENPNAIVFCYGNSEPFLHPKLPECIASIKRRGLNAQISTNCNLVRRVDELLAARPDMIIISLSGFTQDIYVRGHAGGNIEKVKANMRTLAEANGKIGQGVDIAVNFHVYDYNEHEIEPMREYATNLGLKFFTSIARAISMENTIQYCRAHDPDATAFEVQQGRPDWNTAFPAVSDGYTEAMGTLRIPPTEAREMYKDFPPSEVCPVGAGMLFTFIRHDGLVQMCACSADRRITLGNYLDLTPDQMIEKRTGHSICKQCIKYRLNLYYMIADRNKWVSP
jgi:MoaA/NifB/PqqE/SkfB family radical SAM enzyme